MSNANDSFLILNDSSEEENEDEEEEEIDNTVIDLREEGHDVDVQKIVRLRKRKRKAQAKEQILPTFEFERSDGSKLVRFHMNNNVNNQSDSGPPLPRGRPVSEIHYSQKYIEDWKNLRIKHFKDLRQLKNDIKTIVTELCGNVFDLLALKDNMFRLVYDGVNISNIDHNPLLYVDQFSSVVQDLISEPKSPQLNPGILTSEYSRAPTQFRMDIPYEMISDLVILSSKLYRKQSDLYWKLSDFFNHMFIYDEDEVKWQQKYVDNEDDKNDSLLTSVDHNFDFTTIHWIIHQYEEKVQQLVESEVERQRLEYHIKHTLADQISQMQIHITELKEANNMLKKQSQSYEAHAKQLYDGLAGSIVKKTEHDLELMKLENRAEDLTVTSLTKRIVENMKSSEKRLKQFEEILNEVLSSNSNRLDKDTASKLSTLQVHLSHVQKKFDPSWSDSLQNLSEELDAAMERKMKSIELDMEAWKVFQTDYNKLTQAKDVLENLEQEVMRLKDFALSNNQAIYEAKDAWEDTAKDIGELKLLLSNPLTDIKKTSRPIKKQPSRRKLDVGILKKKNTEMFLEVPTKGSTVSVGTQTDIAKDNPDIKRILSDIPPTPSPTIDSLIELYSNLTDNSDIIRNVIQRVDGIRKAYEDQIGSLEQKVADQKQEITKLVRVNKQKTKADAKRPSTTSVYKSQSHKSGETNGSRENTLEEDNNIGGRKRLPSLTTKTNNVRNSIQKLTESNVLEDNEQIQLDLGFEDDDYKATFPPADESVPFTLDDSQERELLRKALKHKFSMIPRPPTSGKLTLGSPFSRKRLIQNRLFRDPSMDYLQQDPALDKFILKPYGRYNSESKETRNHSENDEDFIIKEDWLHKYILDPAVIKDLQGYQGLSLPDIYRGRYKSITKDMSDQELLDYLEYRKAMLLNAQLHVHKVDLTQMLRSYIPSRVSTHRSMKEEDEESTL